MGKKLTVRVRRECPNRPLGVTKEYWHSLEMWSLMLWLYDRPICGRSVAFSLASMFAHFILSWERSPHCFASFSPCCSISTILAPSFTYFCVQKQKNVVWMTKPRPFVTSFCIKSNIMFWKVNSIRVFVPLMDRRLCAFMTDGKVLFGEKH